MILYFSGSAHTKLHTDTRTRAYTPIILRRSILTLPCFLFFQQALMWPTKLPVKEIPNADTQDAIKEAFFRIHLQKKFDWGTEETRGGQGGGGFGVTISGCRDQFKCYWGWWRWMISQQLSSEFEKDLLLVDVCAFWGCSQLVFGVSVTSPDASVSDAFNFGSTELYLKRKKNANSDWCLDFLSQF